MAARATVRPCCVASIWRLSPYVGWCRVDRLSSQRVARSACLYPNDRVPISDVSAHRWRARVGMNAKIGYASVSWGVGVRAQSQP